MIRSTRTMVSVGSIASRDGSVCSGLHSPKFSRPQCIPRVRPLRAEGRRMTGARERPVARRLEARTMALVDGIISSISLMRMLPPAAVSSRQNRRPSASAARSPNHRHALVRMGIRHARSLREYAGNSSVRVIAGKVPRHRWHLRQRRHCGICNLQNLRDPQEFESHSLAAKVCCLDSTTYTITSRFAGNEV
jgi:hypothetical protein